MGWDAVEGDLVLAVLLVISKGRIVELIAQQGQRPTDASAVVANVVVPHFETDRALLFRQPELADAPNADNIVGVGEFFGEEGVFVIGAQ